jgi:hypothetical protein
MLVERLERGIQALSARLARRPGAVLRWLPGGRLPGDRRFLGGRLAGGRRFPGLLDSVINADDPALV